jgi:hypothetical protein
MAGGRQGHPMSSTDPLRRYIAYRCTACQEMTAYEQVGSELQTIAHHKSRTEGQQPMSPILALISNPTAAAVDDTTALEERIALIACGKTQACDGCLKKGDALLQIASTGAADALAATICGTGKGPACVRCDTKSREIIHAYNEEAK